MEALARVLLPEIQAFFESEEGQREFAERKAQQEKFKRQFHLLKKYHMTGQQDKGGNFRPALGHYSTFSIEMINPNTLPTWIM